MAYSNAPTAITNLFPWTPADYGLVAVAIPPEITEAANSFTSQQVLGFRVRVAARSLVTGVVWGQSAAGSTLTAGQNLMGLYTTSGTRLAITGDLTSDFGSGTGDKSAAFTATATIDPNDYFIMVLSNGTTPVSLRRSDNIASANGKNTVETNCRVIRSALSTWTELPASFDIVSDFTVAGTVSYVGLY